MPSYSTSVTLSKDEKDEFDNINSDAIKAMRDADKLKRLESYMRQEGCHATADAARGHLQDLYGARMEKKSADMNVEAEEALSSLNTWQEEIRSQEQEVRAPGKATASKPPGYPAVRGGEVKFDRLDQDRVKGRRIIEVVNGGRAGSPNKVEGPWASRSIQEVEWLVNMERVKGNDSFRSLDYEEAVQHYTAALDLKPPRASLVALLHNNRAAAHMKLKQWARAVEDCSAVLQLDPNPSSQVKALFRRAASRMECKDYSLAVQDYEAALQLEPENGELRRGMEKALNHVRRSGMKKMMVEEVSDDDEEEEEDHSGRDGDPRVQEESKGQALGNCEAKAESSVEDPQRDRQAGAIGMAHEVLASVNGSTSSHSSGSIGPKEPCQGEQSNGGVTGVHCQLMGQMSEDVASSIACSSQPPTFVANNRRRIFVEEESGSDDDDDDDDDDDGGGGGDQDSVVCNAMGAAPDGLKRGEVSRMSHSDGMTAETGLGVEPSGVVANGTSGPVVDTGLVPSGSCAVTPAAKSPTTAAEDVESTRQGAASNSSAAWEVVKEVTIQKGDLSEGKRPEPGSSSGPDNELRVLDSLPDAVTNEVQVAGSSSQHMEGPAREAVEAAKVPANLAGSSPGEEILEPGNHGPREDDGSGQPEQIPTSTSAPSGGDGSSASGSNLNELLSMEAQAGLLREKGNTCFQSGNWAESVLWYTRGLELVPNNSTLYSNRALARLKLGDFWGAHKDSSQAIALDPSSHKAFHRRGLAKRELGDLEGAKADLYNCHKIAPKAAKGSISKDVGAVITALLESQQEGQVPSSTTGRVHHYASVTIEELEETPEEKLEKVKEKLNAAELEAEHRVPQLCQKAKHLEEEYQRSTPTLLEAAKYAAAAHGPQTQHQERGKEQSQESRSGLNCSAAHATTSAWVEEHVDPIISSGDLPALKGISQEVKGAEGLSASPSGGQRDDWMSSPLASETNEKAVDPHTSTAQDTQPGGPKRSPSQVGAPLPANSADAGSQVLPSADPQGSPGPSHDQVAVSQGSPSRTTDQSGSKATTGVPLEEQLKALRDEGSVAFRRGDVDEAERCWQRCTEVDRGHVPAWTNLALLYNSINDFSTARDVCDEALKYDPINVKAWHRRAVAMESLGQLQGACVSLERLIELLGPENVDDQVMDMYLRVRRGLGLGVFDKSLPATHPDEEEDHSARSPVPEDLPSHLTDSDGEPSSDDPGHQGSLSGAEAAGLSPEVPDSGVARGEAPQDISKTYTESGPGSRVQANETFQLAACRDTVPSCPCGPPLQDASSQGEGLPVDEAVFCEEGETEEQARVPLVEGTQCVGPLPVPMSDVGLVPGNGDRATIDQCGEPTTVEPRESQVSTTDQGQPSNQSGSQGEGRDDILESLYTMFDGTAEHQVSPIGKVQESTRHELQQGGLVGQVDDSTHRVAGGWLDRAEECRKRGNAFFASSRLAEALAAYNKALTWDRDSLPAALSFANRAMVYIKMGEFNEAVADCDAALALDPLYVKALHRKAVALKELGKLKESRAVYTRLKTLQPNSRVIIKESADVDAQVRQMVEQEVQAARKTQEASVAAAADDDDDDVALTLKQWVDKMVKKAAQNEEVSAHLRTLRTRQLSPKRQSVSPPEPKGMDGQPDGMEGRSSELPGGNMLTPAADEEMGAAEEAVVEFTGPPLDMGDSPSLCDAEGETGSQVDSGARRRYRLVIEDVDGFDDTDEEHGHLGQQRKLSAPGTSTDVRTAEDVKGCPLAVGPSKPELGKGKVGERSGTVPVVSVKAKVESAAELAVRHLATSKMSAPKSSAEFDRCCRILLSDGHKLSEYVGTVDPSSYSFLFKESLSPQTVRYLVLGLKGLVESRPAFVPKALRALAGVKRFEFVVRMLSPNDKATLRGLIDKLAEAGEDGVEGLRRHYGML